MSNFGWKAIAAMLLVVVAGCTADSAGDHPASGVESAPKPAVEQSDASDASGNSEANGVTLAVYLPENYRNSRSFYYHKWLLEGRELETGVMQVVQHYFPKSFILDRDTHKDYGLLLVVHPKWSGESGRLHLKLQYRVYAKGGTVLLQGEQSYVGSVGSVAAEDGILKAALHDTQDLVEDMLAKLNPDEKHYPAVNHSAEIDPLWVVDHEKPVDTGTGFFINPAGQIVTAAHVVHACEMTEVRQGDKVFRTQQGASSLLIDVAVMSTGQPAAASLALRQGEHVLLGEPIVDVGFPLQPQLSSSPTLTRGNVSAMTGMSGSLGLFQFSAPIQPGSSGGPVVSDEGELLGVTDATLNAAALIKQGVIPQNVNFAVDARYLAAFMRREHVDFSEVAPGAKGDSQVGNQAALAAVVSVACYQ